MAGVSDDPMAWFDYDLIDRIRGSGVDVSMSTETRELLKAAQEAVNEGRVASITDYITNPAARAAAESDDETRPRGEGDPGGSEYVAGVSDNPMAWFDHDLIERIRGSGVDVSMSTETRETLKAAQEAVNEGRVASITDYVTNPAARAAADQAAAAGAGAAAGSGASPGADGPSPTLPNAQIAESLGLPRDASYEDILQASNQSVLDAADELGIGYDSRHPDFEAIRERVNTTNQANYDRDMATWAADASALLESQGIDTSEMTDAQMEEMVNPVAASAQRQHQRDVATWAADASALLESQGIDTSEMTDAQMEEMVNPVAASAQRQHQRDVATWAADASALLESQGIDTSEMTDAQMAEMVDPVAASAQRQHQRDVATWARMPARCWSRRVLTPAK